jgi:hypothetical protein
MCLIIYKLIICLLSIYICLCSSSFSFNSQVFNVSNCILLNNYAVFMKKNFSDIVLSMMTFHHVVISKVTKIQLGTKTWHI